MVLLQAAIGLGLLMMVIFGVAIFIGIPVLTNSFYNFFTKKLESIDRKEKIKIRVKSLLFAIIIVIVILFLIWTFYLSKIDLTYS